MKKLNLLMAAISLSLASCTAYHISTVNSTNVTKDEGTGDFVRENDSLKIVYSFSGFKAPVSIQVFNKLDQPLYIDWQRSAIIVDDIAQSYAGKKVAIEGSINTESNSIRIGRWNTTSISGNIHAVAELPKDVTFIPPHSGINNTPINVLDNSAGYTHQLSESAQNYAYAPTADGGILRVKTADFDEQHSPLKFKSYLTLYINNGRSTKMMVLEDNFYVSKFMKSLVLPSKLQGMQASSRGDVFYTRN